MVTEKWVRTGILVRCQISLKRVLPSELRQCSVTGQRVLKEYLVARSISQRLLLKDQAIASKDGTEYCADDEAISCGWSGRSSHPSDVSICNATGLEIRTEYLARNGSLLPLVKLLDRTVHTQDGTHLGPKIAELVQMQLGNGRVRMQAAVLSPDGKSLAFRCEVKTFLGMMTNYAGAVFSIPTNNIVGRIVRPDDVTMDKRAS